MSGMRKMSLNLSQVQADLFMARSAIKEAEHLSPKAAKYIKGQAGYHLQQAAEKMIKIQLYDSTTKMDYAKVYKHSIDDLLFYADSLKVNMIVPAYVKKQKTVISSWEAEGRYDVHFVVRLPQLKKTLQELSQWHQLLKKIGYK